MDITFYGHACFALREKNLTVLTDPYDESLGLSLPKVSAHVVTSSFDHPFHHHVKGLAGTPVVYDWPGEYEFQGTHFKGIHSFHNSKDDKEQLENIIFHMVMGDIRLCHLGAQGTKLTSEQLEKAGEVDVLFVPVGGKGGMDAKKAKEVVEQVEPRIIIPMMYDTEGSKAGLDSLQSFLSVMGAKAVEPLDKFTVRRSELPEENSKVVVLNAL